MDDKSLKRSHSKRLTGLLASLAGIALTGTIFTVVTLSSAPVEAAVVYCKTAGVPKGCVARPTAPAIVYCTAPGVPVGCRARPPAGTPTNRGGPVNHLGRW